MTDKLLSPEELEKIEAHNNADWGGRIAQADRAALLSHIRALEQFFQFEDDEVIQHMPNHPHLKNGVGRKE
jgi:hypothetical protein